MTQDEAEKGIIHKWCERPANQRTATDVLIFYGELTAAGSSLLSFTYSGDKYQWIAGRLRRRGLVTE